MSTWIIAFNKDGNTSSLKVNSGKKPDLNTAASLVTRKAERESYDVVDLRLFDSDDAQTPAMQLIERYGIAITGIARL